MKSIASSMVILSDTRAKARARSRFLIIALGPVWVWDGTATVSGLSHTSEAFQVS
ncbi:hypothetical protein QCA50_017531 [Cerrena zonata]|uniref:Uncharacterized protein n=1 Tax=Cerrena zonata TaxID=2478898 RepID=A0AAW0FGV9_9APHY